MAKIGLMGSGRKRVQKTKLKKKATRVTGKKSAAKAKVAAKPKFAAKPKHAAKKNAVAKPQLESKKQPTFEAKPEWNREVAGAELPEKMGGMRTASGALALSKAKRGTVSAKAALLRDVAYNQPTPHNQTLSKQKGHLNRPRRGDMVRSSGSK